VIFIDSNIPMYLIGAPHPNKDAAIRAIEAVMTKRERMVTSAEVLQEILYRYHRAGRHDLIQPCIKTLKGLVDDIFAVEEQDVLRARDVLLGTPGLSARDAVHVALMERHQVERILSFDLGFDRVKTISRIG
jgi:predicted nucleic acid-binding protein